ncbi:MAG: hypothetical protein D6685_02865, partial [Bacteroidetes bacterium]
METRPSSTPLDDLRALLLGKDRRPLPDLLSDLAPLLPADVYDPALNAALSIGLMGRSARLDALAQLLLHAPEPVRRVWLERALPHMPPLADYLPDVLLAPARAALENTADAYDQENRARALAALVQRLPEPQGNVLLTAEMLRVVEERRWDWERVLAALAPGLRGAPARTAAPVLLDAARGMASAFHRARVLIHLLPFLPASEGDAARDDALAAARAADAPALLAALRPHVAPHDREALWHEALTRTRALPDPAERAETLATLAPYADPQDRPALHDEIQAIDLASLDSWTITRWFDPPPQEERPALLAFLSPVQQEQALDAVYDEPWPLRRAWLLAGMIPALAPEPLSRVLGRTADLEEPALQALVLRALAPVLSDDLLPHTPAATLAPADER